MTTLTHRVTVVLKPFCASAPDFYIVKYGAAYRIFDWLVDSVVSDQTAWMRMMVATLFVRPDEKYLLLKYQTIIKVAEK